VSVRELADITAGIDHYYGYHNLVGNYQGRSYMDFDAKA